MRWPHKEIFEVDAVTAAEGREIQEPDRKADSFAVPTGNRTKQPWIAAEQGVRNVSLGRLDLMREFLVCGKLADEIEDEAGFVRARAANVERHQRYTATSALICGCGS